MHCNPMKLVNSWILYTSTDVKCRGGKVTAIFSIMAYVWLIVILDWISPNVVEIWEAATVLRLGAELLRSSQDGRWGDSVGPIDSW